MRLEEKNDWLSFQQLLMAFDWALLCQGDLSHKANLTCPFFLFGLETCKSCNFSAFYTRGKQGVPNKCLHCLKRCFLLLKVCNLVLYLVCKSIVSDVFPLLWYSVLSLGNDISQVEGLEGLQQLRELVLDKNRIKSLAENSFISQKVLLELHLAENRIRELNHLDPLTELRKLFLGMNKLQVFSS